MSHTLHFAMAVGLSFFMYIFYMVISYWKYFGPIFRSEIMAAITWSVLKVIFTNPLLSMHFTDWLLLTIAAILSGIYLSLVLYIHNYRKTKTPIQMQTSGMLANILVLIGTGCAACGSLVLMGLLSSVGVLLGVTMLSWLSKIIMLAALLLLLHANTKLYQQAKNPLVCQI